MGEDSEREQGGGMVPSSLLSMLSVCGARDAPGGKVWPPLACVSKECSALRFGSIGVDGGQNFGGGGVAWCGGQGQSGCPSCLLCTWVAV